MVFITPNMLCIYLLSNCVSPREAGSLDTGTWCYLLSPQSLEQDLAHSKCSINSGGVGEFPGGPVVRTQRFHCRGAGSIPCRGTKIPKAIHVHACMRAKSWSDSLQPHEL